jgi:RHS repeat-associated protein
VLQSQAGEDTTQYVYALGTRPLAQYSNDVPEYLLADALGSVRQIVDGSGNVTLAESHEPYGSVLMSNGTASSIFGYSGEQVDTSGLVYLRARYMQPTLGIFLARDPWSGDQLRPGSMNGWNYGDDNPVNRIDPSGRFSAVAITNGLYNQPTVVGLDRTELAFSTMADHLGWISLLLDADDSQYQ